MASINRPSKEQVRAWLAERRQRGLPLPSSEQIRHQLGWEYQAGRAAPPINGTGKS